MSEDLARAFNEEDREQLSRHGIGLDDAVRQLELLREPVPRFRRLDRPARVDDGVKRLDARLVSDLLPAASEARLAGRVSKFVPASGAATRMFQGLLKALDDYERGTIDEHGRDEVTRFFGALPRLALRHELVRAGILPDDPVPSSDRDRSRLLFRILSATEIGLASRPKGLVPFHSEQGKGRTPFEEHLHEAILYTTDARGVARAHFTVPDSNREAFEALLEEARGKAEASRVRFDVSFSSQSGSTDTIAAGPDGRPFRDDDGRLLLRPGGHGALLRNLQQTGGDVVVVKNIDNVVPVGRAREVSHWNHVLAGYLVTLQQSVHAYLREIHEDGNEPHWLDQGLVFAEQQLSIQVPPSLRGVGADGKREFLVRALDRPIRVCGMVRNEGEPGGGPFWVRDKGDRVGLQIVEAAEVNRSNEEQAAILRAATHFNPVDLAVGLRNWKGEPFDLARFADHDAVIRTSKSSFGRPLTVLERPGLWNGAMADWITVFVEVPISIFAPVKTVFDLLRPEHQEG